MTHCSSQLISILAVFPTGWVIARRMRWCDWHRYLAVRPNGSPGSSCFFGLKSIIYSAVINVCPHSRLCLLNVQCIDWSVLPIFLSWNAHTLKVKGQEGSNNRISNHYGLLLVQLPMSWFQFLMCWFVVLVTSMCVTNVSSQLSAHLDEFWLFGCLLWVWFLPDDTP